MSRYSNISNSRNGDRSKQSLGSSKGNKWRNENKNSNSIFRIAEKTDQEFDNMMIDCLKQHPHTWLE